ncbi:MAG TPA: hypothetical protein DD791_08595 [Syntrophomonas sp.]|nr:hypothetical protein [Syntrophomonas sp.]
MDYRHLNAMTDNNGILQFSRLQTPDPNSGYTLDDNARALIVALSREDGYDLAGCYATYLYRSQHPDSWSNFELNGQFSSSFDSEDSVGRALLACSLGTTSHWPEIRKICIDMLVRNLPQTFDFSSPRAIAYTLVGLCKGEIPVFSEKLLHIISLLSNRLINLYQLKHDKAWFWFEDYLTYCNGILPQSLFAAYSLNGDKKALKIGYDSLSFLNDILFRNGYLNIIGNQGWYNKGGVLPLFDQQPVDAASIYFACMEAYESIGNREYLSLAKLAHAWYRGANVHSLSLCNVETGGCFDALTVDGVNLNQGAESTLSLILCDLHADENMQLETEDECSS